MEKGRIFNIQRFCINDGPGIRTTVFFKGCPLSCAWCHNPESKRARRELSYHADKCLHCGRCAARCPNGCHQLTPQGHVLDREGCVVCGACVQPGCPALELIGREADVDEVIREVCKDRLFYRNSGGGMTLSGGEPLAQFRFARALLEAARREDIPTAIETCGCAPAEQLRELVPLVDLFLYDYKLTDPELHKRYTGVDNGPLLENLHLIDGLGGESILRCPIIPEINDTPDHFEGIARTAASLRHVREVQLEPYHPLGESKAEAIGVPYDVPAKGFPEKETVDGWLAEVARLSPVPVRQA